MKIELIKRVPSLILLDVWLDQSNADGIDILKVLKKSYPYIPVIMIRGHGTIDMAINALKIGAFDFIEKPFNMPSLIDLLENYGIFVPTQTQLPDNKLCSAYYQPSTGIKSCSRPTDPHYQFFYSQDLVMHIDTLDLRGLRPVFSNLIFTPLGLSMI